jgi:hypothetical protein
VHGGYHSRAVISHGYVVIPLGADTLAAIVEKLVLTVLGDVGRYRSASAMAKCRLPLSTPAQSTCSLLSSSEELS